MKSVYAACAASLAIGLFFIFVWAPHPWGWEGFDQYHQLALAVAHGQPFPTMEVPWGYAYFLAAFYRLLGDHPWIPLVVQALLNACVPLLVFALARRWFDEETAAVASVLTGIFSFNTVYASTQSSDAVCTVIFMAAVLAFVRALEIRDRRPEKDPRGRDVHSGRAWPWFALTGVLCGLAPQFRPNLVLIPVLLAAYALWRRRSARILGQVTVMIGCVAAMLAPWVLRNYRLTRTLLPTSVHGGVQLWYGTLQVGPYLNSRAYNPRAAFEAPTFDYTSLEDVPLIVSAAEKACAPGRPTAVALTYWTDHDPSRRNVRPSAATAGAWTFEIPPPHRDAVVYYYFTTDWPDGRHAETPAAGALAPFVYFVTRDHLGDPDVRGDFLDVFDLVRAARAHAWAVPLAGRIDAAGVDAGDPAAIARLLADSTRQPDIRAAAALTRVDRRDDAAVLRFGDGSSITIPRRWSSRITDLTFAGRTAQALMHAYVPVRSLQAGTVPRPAPDRACAGLEDVTVNAVFYRREPHLMRRYSALAWDNIRRAPLAFAATSVYRAFRLFIIYGTGDSHTAQQFQRSRLVYLAGTLASALCFVLLVAGVIVAWRARRDVALPLLLVLYVPATIAPVLTNMRYTITVQPIEFMFVAAALTAILERSAWRRPRQAAPGRAGNRTAHQP